jgi:hypothetical protein
MDRIFVIVGSAALATAFLAFAWEMLRRQWRNGPTSDDSYEADIGMYPGL